MATVPSSLQVSTSTVAVDSAGPFSLGFRLFDTDSLDVYVNNVRSTAYTVSATFANGYDDNASITFTSALVAGTALRIEGALTPQRTADLINGPSNLIGKLNVEFGRLWSALVQIKRDSERAVRGFAAIDPDPSITAASIVSASSYATAAAASASAAAASAAAAAAAQNTILKPKGQWLTATAYVLGDIVYQTGSSYECIVAHTSGTFATDLAANKWRIFVAQGAAGAGTGDVLAANNGSEYTAAASSFRLNTFTALALAARINSSDMLTAFTESGFRRIGTSNTNVPTGGAAGDALIVNYENSDNRTLIWLFQTGGIAINCKVAGTWTGWSSKFATESYVQTQRAQVLHVRDEKSSGTAGGTFTSGAYQTRTLNTVKTNTISGASLASNQITLPAGTYQIEASAPAYNAGNHRAKLYNVTDGADVLYGQTAFGLAGTAYATTTLCPVIGQFTLAAQKVLELRHIAAATRATDGFGVAANLGSLAEVYTEVFIRKIA